MGISNGEGIPEEDAAKIMEEHEQHELRTQVEGLPLPESVLMQLLNNLQFYSDPFAAAATYAEFGILPEPDLTFGQPQKHEGKTKNQP